MISQSNDIQNPFRIGAQTQPVPMARVFQNALQEVTEELTEASLTLHHPNDILFVSDCLGRFAPLGRPALGMLAK